VDSAGNVFVTSFDAGGVGTIFKFAHGGTSPIETLADPGAASGCAVDPKTGNLAVTNVFDNGNPYSPYRGSVAIYQSASGDPKMHYTSNSLLGAFFFCGYDPSGNLYLSAENTNNGTASLLVRLTGNGTNFQVINLGSVLSGASSVQWDGAYMTVTSGASAQHFIPLSIYRLSISGSNATIVGTTTLAIHKNKFGGQSWIDSSSVLAVTRGVGFIGRWKYPRGDKPSRRVPGAAPNLFGVAVSNVH
jgi:hypothetical protein